MDQSLKKVKVKWDNAAEKQLIDIWADLLTEHSGKMITRKAREKIATARLNRYLQEELGITEQYSESAVHNKVDNFLKKGKQMYLTYQKTGETGKVYTKDDVAIDEEAAQLAWPNFSTFFARFKDHPSLGPGSVEDAAITPGPVIREEIVTSDSGSTEIPNTPSTPRCPSRSSNRTSVDGSDDDHDEVIALGEDEEDDEDSIPTKKKLKASTPIPRVSKKRNSTSNAGQFLFAFGEIQAAAQQRQIEHEQKMQQTSVAFQQQLELDRVKFEAQLASTLQQQNNQFQLSMMQQNQAFQAELLKKLFEKNDS